MQKFDKAIKELTSFTCMFDINLDGFGRLNRYCAIWKARNFFHCRLCPLKKEKKEDDRNRFRTLDFCYCN
jgi:hypothetical protein